MVDKLIITPTYNEIENLETFVEGVFEHLPETDILVVDDSSPDGTGKLADRLAKDEERIHVVHREGKQGLGTAYRAGFTWALERDYQYVFEMDTDLSHDPVYLPLFLRALEDDADLVIGSRNVPGGSVEGWGPMRHLISKGGSIYSRTVLGVKVKDLTSGYKGFRRRVLETLEWDAFQSEGFFFQVETNYRTLKAGFTIREVPIVFKDRTAGQSKMSGSIFIEALYKMWQLRFS
ncbi:MAG: polyprenol monophosphomannose synthase [Deltaproteobacteria bacterium]|nr:polyprenol monophosphomannose synthase [Deltaproteobacteria bacterium]